MDLKDLKRRAGITEQIDEGDLEDIRQQITSILDQGLDKHSLIEQLTKATASRVKAAYNEGRTYGQVENLRSQREPKV